MAQGRVPFNAVAACGAPPGFDTAEAAFDAALLREQYRSLARLGPYVHGIVIVAALAFFGATPTGSLLTGILLPTALIAVSVFRSSSWFKARAGVELEALDRVRRKVRAASVLGPTLTFAFALATAISTWQGGVAEFTLALLAVWVVATVCAMCLNRIAREANVIVIAATAFLIIAFVARGSGLTLGLAPLVAIAACFIIRMLDEQFRMFAEIVRSRFVIAEQQRVAEEAREAAMTIALTDDLTGLPNRRCFQGLLAERITARDGNRQAVRARPDRSRRLQADQRRSWPSRRRRNSQTSRRPARQGDGRARLSRQDGRRRIRDPLRRHRRARRGDCLARKSRRSSRRRSTCRRSAFA